ncbi:MAG: Na+/H+ antiporter subunit B [Anaerolineales bacterium]|nr:Na+/H+ antiporter subunit B [Anaerolineales bacterium]
MISLVLRTATRYLLSLMLLFSIFILIRGENEPGGGFDAGLIAAAAFVLYALATDVSAARSALHVDPRTLVGTGLLTAIASGGMSLLLNEPFLTGHWTGIYLPVVGSFEIGTPLIFDIGVYLVVWGVPLMIIFPLAEE